MHEARIAKESSISSSNKHRVRDGEISCTFVENIREFFVAKENVHTFPNVLRANVTSARRFPGEFPGKCDVSVAGGPLSYTGTFPSESNTEQPIFGGKLLANAFFLAQIVIGCRCGIQRSSTHTARYFLSNRTKVKYHQKAKTIFCRLVARRINSGPLRTERTFGGSKTF